MKRKNSLFLWGAALFSLLSLSSESWAEAKPISLVVPIPPIQFLAERIGGEAVTVQTLLPPGRDPHTYTPLPGQLRELARASCFFYLGLPLEMDLLRARGTGEGLRVISLLSGISLRTMEHRHHHHEDAEHDHGKSLEDSGDNEEHHAEGSVEHSHHSGDAALRKDAVHEEKPGENPLPNLEGYDPHVWLNPRNMALMARTMEKALQELDPSRKDIYAANADVLVDQLEVLHGYLESVLKPVRGRTLLVFHPAYGYFCHAYGLRQMAVEREGKAPKGKELTDLIRIAKEERIQAIFTQPQFDQRTAQTVAAAIGARVLSFDPFPLDYMAYLQTMGAILRRELQTP